MCIGVNADPATCDSANGPLPIYTGDTVSITCDSCFAGFKADVFFDLHIRDFTLRSLSGGFRNVSVNAGLGVDMEAHVEKPILAVDKALVRRGGEDRIQRL